jgi:hypothetical protein
MKPWNELSPQERNALVGDTLGFKPVTQCWFGCDGQNLIRTAWSEEQRGAAESLCRMVQLHDKLWTESLADWPSIKPEMRGRLEVIVERWHIRYSDTPGGGWTVIEWLRARGQVQIRSVDAGWLVSNDGLAEIAPTMAEPLAGFPLPIALRR